MLDRNLQHLSLVEVLYWYPIDGVVLIAGCGIDKSGDRADNGTHAAQHGRHQTTPCGARVPHSAEYARPRRG